MEGRLAYTAGLHGWKIRCILVRLRHRTYNGELERSGGVGKLGQEHAWP